MKLFIDELNFIKELLINQLLIEIKQKLFDMLEGTPYLHANFRLLS